MELHELVMDSTMELCWMEAGHWLKLEEDFKEAGHWDQPHLSFLTYRSLLDIHRALAKGGGASWGQDGGGDATPAGSVTVLSLQAPCSSMWRPPRWQPLPTPSLTR